MSMKKIQRLKKKAYRDAFVQAHITQGLAYQIRALRSQRGWTQDDLRQLLGYKSQSAVARLEDPGYGKLSLSTLSKLSKTFDVALLVKFVPYSRFLKETEDLSPRALSAESFDVELPKLESGEDEGRYQILSTSVGSMHEPLINIHMNELDDSAYLRS